VQDIASLKMRTRVSMGDCQGRMCVGYCSDRLRQATGRQDVGWLRPRFPMDPIPFSAFQSSARRPFHEPSSTTSSLPAAA
jgi:hydrogen cyanide synthase HcnB